MTTTSVGLRSLLSPGPIYTLGVLVRPVLMVIGQNSYYESFRRIYAENTIAAKTKEGRLLRDTIVIQLL